MATWGSYRLWRQPEGDAGDGAKIAVYSVSKGQHAKRPHHRKTQSLQDHWLFSDRVPGELKAESVLREAQKANSGLSTLYNQFFGPSHFPHIQPLSKANHEKYKIPKLTLTPSGVIGGDQGATPAAATLYEDSQRTHRKKRKYMPQTSMRVVQKQRESLPPLRPTLIDQQQQLQHKIIKNYYSLDSEADMPTFYSTARVRQSPPGEQLSSFERLMKKHSISYQHHELPDSSLPQLVQIHDESVANFAPSVRRHHALEPIQDLDEAASPFIASDKKIPTLRVPNQDLVVAKIETKPAEIETPPSMVSPLRKLTPAPPETPLSLKRSIEKIKIVGFMLPNGAHVKVKRELHPLLEQVTHAEEAATRKFYSPTPQEDVTYDTLLLKETMAPVKSNQDVPQPTSELVLAQKKVLESVGVDTLELKELEMRVARRDYLKSGGEVTLATDIDGASTDSQQPNLIGPLYHKRMAAQGAGAMRIEPTQPVTMYNTTASLLHSERKPRLHSTFTLFKSSRSAKARSPGVLQLLPPVDSQQSNRLLSLTNSFYDSPYATKVSSVRKFKREQQELGEARRLEVEAEMSTKLESLIRKFVHATPELERRYNLTPKQMDASVALFRRLCLASLKQLHGFVRTDLAQIGVIPEELSKELRLPLFLLAGLNPCYTYESGRGKSLVNWLDFVKLLSTIYFRTVGAQDTLVFIFRSLCLTRHDCFTEHGLFRAVSKAVRHSNFFYPPHIRRLWDTIYPKLAGIKSLYVDMSRQERPNVERSVLERARTPTRPGDAHYYIQAEVNDPAAGIINHERLEKRWKKDPVAQKAGELSLDIEAACELALGYVSPEQVGGLAEWLVGR